MLCVGLPGSVPQREEHARLWQKRDLAQTTALHAAYGEPDEESPCQMAGTHDPQTHQRRPEAHDAAEGDGWRRAGGQTTGLGSEARLGWQLLGHGQSSFELVFVLFCFLGVKKRFCFGIHFAIFVCVFLQF